MRRRTAWYPLILLPGTAGKARRASLTATRLGRLLNVSPRPDSDSLSALPAQDRLRVRLIAAVGPCTRPLSHRGVWRLCRLICGGAEAGRTRDITVHLNSDSSFAFDVHDPYWARLLAHGFVYEPEVENVLRAFADLPYTFVDAGANLGYWSVLASSREFGAHRAIAIEGASQTFERLLGNCDLNANRFQCLHAAVAENAGSSVTFAISARHFSSGIASGAIPEVRGTETVPTTTLDDVVFEHEAETGPVIVKLDVEGAEIEALRGGRRLLERDALVLFEDHGKDPEARVSAAVLELGWSVFLRESHGFVPAGLAEIREYKRRTNIAYNLIACRTGSRMHEEVRARLGNGEARNT
jgi:FkbM family methyltransferase